jgi:hypothetical protein
MAHTAAPRGGLLREGCGRMSMIGCNVCRRN